MLTPFQEILKEFEVIDGSDVQHLLIVLFAMAIGLFVGTRVAHRRDPALNQSKALWRAVIVGIAFPLVTGAMLMALRLTPYGATTGALPKFAVRVFASLVVIRLIARVLRGLFPNSSPVRNMINIVSGVIWLGLVMHLAGVLPLIENELEAVLIPLGKTHVSALTMMQGLMLVAVTVLGALWVSSMLETRLMATGINMSMRLVLSRFFAGDALCAGAVDCAGGGWD